MSAMNEQLIQLGLSRNDAGVRWPDQKSTLRWLSERLLNLLTELPVEDESLNLDGFRANLKECRTVLSKSQSSERMMMAADECFTLCRDYIEGVSTYLLDREAEFKQLVQLFKSALVELSVESNDLQHRFEGSSERINLLTQVTDIRELKGLLAQEVGQLKRIIVEKQRQDEERQQEMAQHIQGLQTRLTEAQIEAALDGLTGVANRRHFDQEIKRWVARRKTDGRPFALALIDVDDFKGVNDNYGHHVGDFALKCMAQFFRGSVRSGDLVARYGGEEFAILLENIELRQAEQKMSNLLSKLSASTFRHEIGEQSQDLGLTASCGLAECGARESQWELIMRADGALYEAKKSGKNKVVATW